MALGGCVPEPNAPLMVDGGVIVEPRDAAEPLDLGLDLGVDPGSDSGIVDGGGPELMEVSHDREFRAVWIATAANINFPSRQGLTAQEQQAELIGMLDLVQSLGLNAIVFQVRPEGDAFYRSTLEPWSRFLSGTQGEDPGYDPLSFVIEEAHARQIEVHAWFNPYRLKTTASSVAVQPHFSVMYPEATRSYGNFLWMDPGEEISRMHTLAVILDVVRRYDVDGVHFDDYFYPYPTDEDFPDAQTYADYMSSGGTLALDDWRRDNVNRMVEEISVAVAAEKSHVRFGISPFGIYRPGIPEGITGLDQYGAIFADPVRWIEAGWLDYLAPQLYWPSSQTRQAYGPLIDWWSSLTTSGRYIFAGNFLSQLDSSAAWTVEEIRMQVSLSRAQRDRLSMGNIFFHIGPLQENRSGIADVFSNELYDRLALTPPLATATHSVEPPQVRVEAGAVQLTADPALRAVLVYELDPDGANLVQTLLPNTETLDLSPGRYALSAVDRSGVESLGVVLEID